MDEERIARLERVSEIYRQVWNPVPGPREGLPLTPEDQWRSGSRTAGHRNPSRCARWSSIISGLTGLQSTSACWSTRRTKRSINRECENTAGSNEAVLSSRPPIVHPTADHYASDDGRLRQGGNRRRPEASTRARLRAETIEPAVLEHCRAIRERDPLRPIGGSSVACTSRPTFSGA